MELPRLLPELKHHQDPQELLRTSTTTTRIVRDYQEPTEQPQNSLEPFRSNSSTVCHVPWDPPQTSGQSAALVHCGSVTLHSARSECDETQISRLADDFNRETTR